MYWTGETIRVDRNDKNSKELAVEKAIEFVKHGYNLFMFPEGTRSRDGKLQRFRRGVGRICLETGAPILPVAMIGTYEMMPAGGKLKLKRSARVAIGKPLEFFDELEAAKNIANDSEDYKHLCEIIAKRAEEEVRALLGESQNAKS
jgi:1-acyl-sn-glycerol-3-phosphate acyltransferase